MDVSPNSFFANKKINPDLKNHIVKNTRRFLLAIIVAVAILSVGWFIYARFFVHNNTQKIYEISKAGDLQRLRDEYVPVPEVVRIQSVDVLQKKTTVNFKPVVSDGKNGEVQNTTPLSIREQALRTMQGLTQSK